MPRKIPEQWVDPKTGKITLEALRYLDDLENGGSGNPNIGTLLSGLNSVTATTTAIVEGTQPLADVVLVGVGSIITQQQAQDAALSGVADLAGGGGALSGYASKSSVGGTRLGPGSVTSATVTVTATGGTGPYIYAWSKISGDTITATLATSATTAFSGTVALGETITASFQCVITDSVLATFTVGPIGVGLSEIS